MPLVICEGKEPEAKNGADVNVDMLQKLIKLKHGAQGVCTMLFVGLQKDCEFHDIEAMSVLLTVTLFPVKHMEI